MTDQVISVYKTLLKEGRTARRIGLFGDSAGGDIIAASVLRLRDDGLVMPGGLLLTSPALDLTLRGDSIVTLADADPVLNTAGLRIAYDQYAAPAEQMNPYVSPVYGDFTKGFPPVLIQIGTKELLLSDAVRLNHALKEAGMTSELDVYEGMIHNFPGVLYGTPEVDAAMKEAAAFWSRVLATHTK